MPRGKCARATSGGDAVTLHLNHRCSPPNGCRDKVVQISHSPCMAPVATAGFTGRRLCHWHTLSRVPARVPCTDIPSHTCFPPNPHSRTLHCPHMHFQLCATLPRTALPVPSSVMCTYARHRGHVEWNGRARWRKRNVARRSVRGWGSMRRSSTQMSEAASSTFDSTFDRVVAEDCEI